MYQFDKPYLAYGKGSSRGAGFYAYYCGSKEFEIAGSNTTLDLAWAIATNFDTPNVPELNSNSSTGTIRVNVFGAEQSGNVAPDHVIKVPSFAAASNRAQDTAGNIVLSTFPSGVNGICTKTAHMYRWNAGSYGNPVAPNFDWHSSSGGSTTTPLVGIGNLCSSASRKHRGQLI